MRELKFIKIDKKYHLCNFITDKNKVEEIKTYITFNTLQEFEDFICDFVSLKKDYWKNTFNGEKNA